MPHYTASLAAAAIFGVLAGTAQAATDAPECDPVYASRPVWADHNWRTLIGVECHGDGATPVWFYPAKPVPPGRLKG